MTQIKEFWVENWANILLIAVGTFAFLTYWLQERKRKIDAASLLVIQIDELMERIREISTYISDGQLNGPAFYESLPLIEENYWNKYKHFFVRDMDSISYSSLNQLYNYASEIQEQQQLMKDLQKNGFYQTQAVYTNLEAQLIANGLNNMPSMISNPNFANAMNSIIPDNVTPENRQMLNSVIQQILAQNVPTDLEKFWNVYRQQQGKLNSVLNQNALTKYMPEQIRISLEKAIKETSMLGIVGSEGYQVLKKISRKKF